MEETKTAAAAEALGYRSRPAPCVMLVCSEPAEIRCVGQGHHPCSDERTLDRPKFARAARTSGTRGLRVWSCVSAG